MKCTITGINGFIGSALKKKLLEMDWEVHEELRPDIDYLFLFGSPSSDNWFKHALTYNIRETIDGFLNVVDFCMDNHIKIIYPSSGTVYEGQTNYSKTKKILDILSSMYRDVLGVRIFAGYGPGEGHKTYYSSVVYSFIKDMKQGKKPIIWGDGNQIRDFIYIDDIVENIIKHRDEVGIIDIGTGVGYSINEVVQIINLKLGTNIEPEFIEKPDLYIENSVCKIPCSYNITLEKGIERIINE